MGGIGGWWRGGGKKKVAFSWRRAVKGREVYGCVMDESFVNIVVVCDEMER